MKQEIIGKSKYCNNKYWPPVETMANLPLEMEELMLENYDNIIPKLKSITNNKAEYDKAIMDILGVIYSLFFNYKDSPNCLIEPKNIHNVFKLKAILEDMMVNEIISPTIPDDESIYESVDSCCEYLNDLANNNSGLNHSFFDYTKDKMDKPQWEEFLLMETIRNEVVDDEVAMMIPGLQHSMKQVMSSNLWDECGNGNIDKFHTTWLRRLLKSLNKEQEIIRYRLNKPWFVSLTSNSLNSFLTSIGKVYQAYGHFLITEGWVAPHFSKMLVGMDRVGLTSNDVQIYFTAHKTIDPFHTAEMLSGIKQMQPKLSSQQLRGIVEGACQAISAGSLMYDKLNKHFNKN